MATSVLFDLDGTLLDTERDFTQVLNNQLSSHGLDPVSALDVRHNVSNGARSMVCLGFGIDENQTNNFSRGISAILLLTSSLTV